MSTTTTESAKATIGELCELVNGRAFKPTEWTTSGLPIIRIQNLNDETKEFNYFEGDYSKKHEVNDGDLLFSWSGTPGTSFGAFFWNRGRGVLNQHIFNVLIEKKRVEKRYFRYAINSRLNEIISHAHGGVGLQHITKGKLESVEIPLPPLSEQKRIADILDKADAIRRKRQEADQHANTMGMALFYDHFGDPRSNPKGWETGTLGDLVHSAKDGPHVSPEYAAEGIPFLSTRNIRPGRLIWEDLKYISQAEADRQWRKCKPEYGDILYTKGGTTGYAKCVDFHEEFAVWVHVAVLKTNVNVANPLWLETMLNTPFCYVQSQSHTRGIVNRDLGLTRMVNIEVLMPPKNEQDKFERRLMAIQETLHRRQRATSEAEDLFNSLVQRAFKGEL